jgi:hypothetical protein
VTWLRRAGAGARWLLVTELRMYVGLARLVARRPDAPPRSLAFPYVGAVSVPLWAFSVLSVVELVVLHLVLPWETVRLVADVLGIWGVVWIFGMTGCHYVYPHLVTDESLRIRNAEKQDLVTVPWTDIAAVAVRERSVSSSRRLSVTEEEPEVVHVVVGFRTNVDVRLKHPLSVVVRGRSHEVHEVRVMTDDPRALVAAVREHAGLRGARRG